jgi:hypothetical protein
VSDDGNINEREAVGELTTDRENQYIRKNSILLLFYSPRIKRDKACDRTRKTATSISIVQFNRNLNETKRSHEFLIEVKSMTSMSLFKYLIFRNVESNR